MVAPHSSSYQVLHSRKFHDVSPTAGWRHVLLAFPIVLPTGAQSGAPLQLLSLTPAEKSEYLPHGQFLLHWNISLLGAIRKCTWSWYSRFFRLHPTCCWGDCRHWNRSISIHFVFHIHPLPGGLNFYCHPFHDYGLLYLHREIISTGPKKKVIFIQLLASPILPYYLLLLCCKMVR